MKPDLKTFFFYVAMYVTAGVALALINKSLNAPPKALAGLNRTPNGLPANEMEG